MHISNADHTVVEWMSFFVVVFFFEIGNYRIQGWFFFDFRTWNYRGVCMDGEWMGGVSFNGFWEAHGGGGNVEEGNDISLLCVFGWAD